MGRRVVAVRTTTTDDGIAVLKRLGPGTVVVNTQPDENPTPSSLAGWQAYMADVLSSLAEADVQLCVAIAPGALEGAQRVLAGTGTTIVPASSVRTTVARLRAEAPAPIIAVWGACSIRTASLARHLDVPIVFLEPAHASLRHRIGQLVSRALLTKRPPNAGDLP
jgi:hypothetical protein